MARDTEVEVVSGSTAEAIAAMLPRLEESQAILAEVIAAGNITEFQLDRVHVPGAGGTTWTVPTVDGEEETKTVEGVIVGYKYTRAYWAKPFSAADPAPPDCASNDAITGAGDRGEYGRGAQNCDVCPLAEWGSKGEGRRSQACKTMVQLFLLRPVSLMPLLVSAPPSSLKTIRPYILRIVSAGIPWWGCVTRLTLEKRQVGGYPTAVIIPQMADRLDADQAAGIKAYADGLRPLVHGTRVDVQVAGEEPPF